MSTVTSNVEVPAGVNLPIYMDNHATSPLDPRVLEAMMPYFTNKFGNAASRNHSFGWEAEQAVETAREQIAKLIGATAKEIIFTSGATESNNLAIKGIAEMYRERGNHIITQVTEHKAVLDTCKRLEKYGYRVTYLPVKADGLIDLEDLKRAMDDKTILVTIMAANNEIGVLAAHSRNRQTLPREGRHLPHRCGAGRGQGPGKRDRPTTSTCCRSPDTRFTAPRAWARCMFAGAIPGCRSPSQIDGGGHERGMRSGTLNVPGIVGLGKACEIAREEMDTEAAYLRGLRDRLRAKLESELDYVQVNGSWEHRLPGNLNMSFVYVEGESLLMGINDVAVSSGSACTSATLEPSYVLKALGLGRRCGAQLNSFRAGPLQHPGGSGLRGRQGDRHREASAPAFTTLRDGAGRHRPDQDSMGGALRQGQVLGTKGLRGLAVPASQFTEGRKKASASKAAESNRSNSGFPAGGVTTWHTATR